VELFVDWVERLFEGTDYFRAVVGFSVWLLDIQVWVTAFGARAYTYYVIHLKEDHFVIFLVFLIPNNFY